MTVRVEPAFVVKESALGTPFIAMEYRSPDSAMPSGQFAFDLPPATSLQEAQRIATFLQEKLKAFTHTQ